MIVSTYEPVRVEQDSLGHLEVPKNVLWGIHTLRAVQNFPITGIPVGHYPELVKGHCQRKPDLTVSC